MWQPITGIQCQQISADIIHPTISNSCFLNPQLYLAGTWALILNWGAQHLHKICTWFEIIHDFVIWNLIWKFTSACTCVIYAVISYWVLKWNRKHFSSFLLLASYHGELDNFDTCFRRLFLLFAWVKSLLIFWLLKGVRNCKRCRAHNWALQLQTLVHFAQLVLALDLK